MKFELINPSDKIFFHAPSLIVAALAIVFFNTKYGAKQIDGDCLAEVPIFAFGGAKEWFEEKHQITNLFYLFQENRLLVANCLKSFKLAGRRTSMNDICKYAHEDGERLLKSIEVKA